MKNKIEIKCPEDWRKGQTIFNFLEWLRKQGVPTNQNARLCDTFHLADEAFDKYYKQWAKEYIK